jgi:predicted Zn-dependent protease
MPAITENWKTVAQLLEDARSSLREEARAGRSTIQIGALKGTLAEFDEFLGHNELELAWDALAQVSEKEQAGPVTWMLLAKAAALMNLRDHARRALMHLEGSLLQPEPAYRLVYTRRYRTPHGRLVWRRPSAVKQTRKLKPA